MVDAKRFWSRVLGFEGGCWEWTGAIDTRGYGNLRVDGKTARAHRVAYSLVHGEIPSGEGHHGTVIMHTCDNRLCCNPDHLKATDQSGNMADMAMKGRRKGFGAGSSNGRAKLTPEQVQAIRADNRGKRTIAPEYGVSPAQVQRVRLGLQWK